MKEDKGSKISIVFCWQEYMEQCELLVILWVCWMSFRFLGNYFTKNLYLIMKMQLSIVTCHQSPKGNEFQIIDVEWKKKSHKRYWYPKFTNDQFDHTSSPQTLTLGICVVSAIYFSTSTLAINVELLLTLDTLTSLP